MPLKKSVRLKKSARANKFARFRYIARMTEGFGAGVIAVMALCVMLAAIMIAAYQPSKPEAASANAEPQKPMVQAAAVKSAATATDSNAAGAESPAKPSTPKRAPVTITGCLERSDETFRLKNTSGADAPVARSWKSGFLKKSTASVEVVDSANRFRLSDHVGQRISVTGMLVDREMQVRSMQRLGISCGSAPRVKI